MKVLDRNFRPFVSQEEISQLVGKLAVSINHDYAGGGLVVCPILTGASLFAADLVRQLTVPCQLHFVKYASYSGMQSSGQVRCLLPFPPSVEGHDVLIVEDVVDTGLSMQVILNEVQRMHPRSVQICTLFFKPASFRGNYEVRYVGREIGNEFIVGYGMDYNEQGRNLPAVYVLDE